MKRTNRVAALVLSAALALSLAACGGGTEGKTPDAGKDPVQAATEKMASATSMTAQMTMDMDMSVSGQTASTSTTMDMTVFNDPMKLKADIKITANGTEQSMGIYADGDKDSYTMYVTADGTSWQKQAATLEELQQYDPKGSMDSYLSMSSSFKEGATEQVNGKDAVKYTGVIPGKDMEELMNTTGALDSLKNIDPSGAVGDDQIKEMFKDMADLPVNLWIDKESGYPVKYEMDMTDMMSTMFKKLLTAMNMDESLMDVTKMQITMVCSDFNAAADFEIPAEAKAA